MKHRFYLGDSVDYRVQVGDKHVIRVIIKGIQYGTFADGEPCTWTLTRLCFLTGNKDVRTGLPR
jgi:iron(III) transport system ATP-binding protein